MKKGWFQLDFSKTLSEFLKNYFFFFLVETKKETCFISVQTTPKQHENPLQTR